MPIRSFAKQHQDRWIIPSVLFTLTIITRIPFRGRMLYWWDTVNFAIALESFDPSHQQPHPPGYILYVGLGRFLNLFVHDANTSLVTISIVSSALAVTGIYLLGSALFDRRVGVVAALLLMISPLHWFYSEITLTYEIELPLAILIVWLLYQLLFYRRYPIVTALVIGIAGGIRQDLLLFMFPFWLLGAVRTGRKRALLSVSALAAAVVVWVIPLLIASGGLQAYRADSQEQYDWAIGPYTVFAQGWGAFTHNLHGVWVAVLWLFGAAGVMLLILPSALISWRGSGSSDAQAGGNHSRQMILFLSMLTIPPMIYFLVLQIGQPGYIMIIAAPLLLLLAKLLIFAGGEIDEIMHKDRDASRGEVDAASATSRLSPDRLALPGVLMISLVIVISTITNLMLLYKANTMTMSIPSVGQVSKSIGPFSFGWENRVYSDTNIVTDEVHAFDPDTTYVAVNAFADWRRLMYYLPDYHVLLLKDNGEKNYYDAFHHGYQVIGGTDVPIPPGVKKLVTSGIDGAPDPQKPVVLSPGVLAYFLENAPEKDLRLGIYSLRR